MSCYEKGAKFERSLVQKFQDKGFIALRSAGSGTIKFIIPDVVAVKKNKIIFIECKSTSKDRISLKKTILSLKKILPISKAEIFLAIKFPRKEERFYKLKEILNKENYTISINEPYLTFEDII